MAVVGVERGGIWLVDLNPVRGSEQRGIRPCLVISNDVVNEYAPTVCVIPFTSNLDGRRFPINVVLTRDDTALKADSLLLCGQIRTVAKERLLRKLSSVKAERMPDIEKALMLYLGVAPWLGISQLRSGRAVLDPTRGSAGDTGAFEGP